MRKILITREENQAIRRHAIEKLGISEEAIYENEASKILRYIKNVEEASNTVFSIFCGTNSNGTVGLVIARQLLALDKKVLVYILGDLNEGSSIFNNSLETLKKMKANVIKLDTIGELGDLSDNLDKSTYLIDAIAGSEFDRAFEGVTDFVIESINNSRKYVISVDMPSGMNATNGDVATVNINPDLIVTFLHMKKGLEQTTRLIGTKIVVENNGIPLESSYAVVPFRPNY